MTRRMTFRSRPHSEPIVSASRSRRFRSRTRRRIRPRSYLIETLEPKMLLAADVTAFPPALMADFDRNGFLDPQDINQLNAALRQEEPDLMFDVNRDGQVNGADRTYWIEVVHRTYAGDANLDGEFNTNDLVTVLQAGLYEDAISGNASWETGDWDGDADFETGDLVVALQGGGFEVGPRPLQLPQIRVLPSDEVLRGDPEAIWDAVVIEGHADPFSVVRLQETGAMVMADANGAFRLERAPLSRVETRFHVRVADLQGRELPEVATTRLRLGPGSIEAGYVTPSSLREKPTLSPEELPASLATVYLPDGMDGRKLIEQYTAEHGARPDQGNPVHVALPADTPVVGEQPEVPGQDPYLAPQMLDGFGSGSDEIPAVVIQGTLEPQPRTLESIERLNGTDDGDIGKAMETGLTAGAAVRIEARIGDGPHGSQGTGKGDSDFFAIRGLQQGQSLVIDVNTPVGSELDSFVFVYDGNGNRLDFNDDNGFSLDSYLVFPVRTAGNYYVSVAAFASYGPLYPNESASGLGVATEGDYELFLAVSPVQEVDVYAFDLQPGDIFGATILGGPNHLTLRDELGTELIGSGQDVTLYHPTDSPLPAGGNVSLSWVVGAPGTYQLAVDGGFGDYELELAVFRPVLESGERGEGQILFLDFDGAAPNAESLFGIGNPEASLSPLSAFLEYWGLEPSDEDAVISAIAATVRENFADVGMRGANGDFASDRVDGHFGIEIVTSWESTDLFGFPWDPFGAPHVSRVIIGGTSEQLGISTIGISESVDVGNFHTTDTGVVLLDLLSAPSSNPNSLNRIRLAEQNVSIIDLIGVAVGNIVTHEAGHFFAAWHTDQFNSVSDLMDQGGYLANTIGLVGPVFGDGDEINVSFGSDQFVRNEGFTGTQDSLSAVSFGLSTGKNDPGMRVVASDPAPNRPLLAAPTEFVLEFLDPFDVSREIRADALTVNGLPANEIEVDGGEQPDEPRTLIFRFLTSPVVQPGRQVLELSEGAVRRLSDGDPLQAYQMEFGFNPAPMDVLSVTPTESRVTLPFESIRVEFSAA